MAPIFANDYQTIKGSPTKDRDDISFGDMKTNGYSIVRSVMVAVMIAIVAVAGVVTFHQPPSLSNGDESSMSSMALVHEDDGGDSDIDTIEFDKVLATANKDGKQPPLISKEESDSLMTLCGDLSNLNFQFEPNSKTTSQFETGGLPKSLGVSSSGCVFLNDSTEEITGLLSITAGGSTFSPINIHNGVVPNVQTIRLSGGGTLVASYRTSYDCFNTSHDTQCGGVVGIIMTFNRPDGSTETETHITRLGYNPETDQGWS